MNPSKQKGTAFETAVVRYLQANGFPQAERRALAGKDDRGDVSLGSGYTDWVLEAKATKSIDLAGALNEASREAANAKAPYYAAVIKRRNHMVDSAYVVVPLWLWATLVRTEEST